MASNDVPKVKRVWTTRMCAIKGCTTCAGSGISMHRFPREEDLLLKWLEATNMNYVSKQTLVCGLHFDAFAFFNRKTLTVNDVKPNNFSRQNIPLKKIKVNKYIKRKVTSDIHIKLNKPQYQLVESVTCRRTEKEPNDKTIIPDDSETKSLKLDNTEDSHSEFDSDRLNRLLNNSIFVVTLMNQKLSEAETYVQNDAAEVAKTYIKKRESENEGIESEYFKITSRLDGIDDMIRRTKNKAWAVLKEEMQASPKGSNNSSNNSVSRREISNLVSENIQLKKEVNELRCKLFALEKQQNINPISTTTMPANCLEQYLNSSVLQTDSPSIVYITDDD